MPCSGLLTRDFVHSSDECIRLTPEMIEFIETGDDIIFIALPFETCLREIISHHTEENKNLFHKAIGFLYHDDDFIDVAASLARYLIGVKNIALLRTLGEYVYTRDGKERLTEMPMSFQTRQEERMYNRFMSDYVET